MANKATKLTESNLDQESNKKDIPQFFVGYSTSFPNDLPINSIFYQKDTGDRYRLDEELNWKFIDNIHE